MDLDHEGWQSILQIFPDMDFTEDFQENPNLQKYLVHGIKANSVGIENPLEAADCPKLDTDFSKMVLVNGLPICTPEKAKKLISFCQKAAERNNIKIDEEMIEMNYEDKPNENGELLSTGQAYVTFQSEEQAKIMAQVYNGSKLGKFVFSSCTFPDFDKIMAYGEDKKDAQSQKDQYLALNDHLLETKKNFYAFQMNKKICIGALYGMTKILWNLEESERAKEYDGSFESDKLFKWSPRGTYLILIKTDKVEFIGGPEMKPILVIAKSKVDTVSFSPCEKYILLYMSKSDTPYEVWNFQTHEMIRDFKQQDNEDAEAFKWSHDGFYIARKTVKKVQEEDDDEEVEQTYMTVYELPSMDMCKDLKGNKSSIFVDGLHSFTWAPHKNVLVYTSFPEGGNMLPSVTFQQIPDRQVLYKHTEKDSVSLSMYHHPQGSYLAVVNKYLENKKKEKYMVSLFYTKDMKINQIPNQKIIIDREIVTFHGVVWEPNHAKVAIHTTVKKVFGYGEVQYSTDASKSLVDVYQLKYQQEVFKNIKVGTIPSDKVQDVYFSGAGNILCTVDIESFSRNLLNFYMITKISNEGQTTQGARIDLKKMKDVRDIEKALASVDDTYEFQKIGKHEVRDRKWTARWDQTGRYFMIHSRKATPFDRTAKYIQFYNIHGELIDKIENVPQLDQVQFRTRASDILSANKIKSLKNDYKKKYGPIVDKEHAEEKKAQNDIIKDKRKKIRDNFLDNFFLPLRKEYEDNMDKYKALFPLKDSDMADQPQDNVNIYQYMEEVGAPRKLDIHVTE